VRVWFGKDVDMKTSEGLKEVRKLVEAEDDYGLFSAARDIFLKPIAELLSEAGYNWDPQTSKADKLAILNRAIAAAGKQES